MKKEKQTNFILSGLILLTAVLFVIFSAEIRHNIIQTLSLAVSTVIPGLFPFLVLSDFACRAVLPAKSKVARFVAEKVFSLPANALPCVLFGLTGGYITGVRSAVSLYESKQISKQQAQKLCLFCVSPGLAFSVCAVGNAMLKSTAAGVLLFASCTLAALFTGFFIPVKEDKNTNETTVTAAVTKAEVFTQAVYNSATACLSISAWMAFFASVQAVCTVLLPSRIHTVFMLFAEVSAGSLQAAKSGSLPLCAAVSGFGGLCIFCQLLPDLLSLEVNIPTFLKYRLLQSGLSALFCKIGLFLFPDLGFSQSVVKMILSRVNPTTSFFLLLMCFIFILDLAPTKKICYDVKKNPQYPHKG